MSNLFCHDQCSLHGKNVLKQQQLLQEKIIIHALSPMWKALLVPFSISKVRAAMTSACRVIASALSTASAPSDDII